VEAIDKETGEHVAIKIIKNTESFHRQAKIEAKILQAIKDNDVEETSCCG